MILVIQPDGPHALTHRHGRQERLDSEHLPRELGRRIGGGGHLPSFGMDGLDPLNGGGERQPNIEVRVDRLAIMNAGALDGGESDEAGPSLSGRRSSA